ncbi:hypothetical protein [Actinophytocola sediminis]
MNRFDLRLTAYAPDGSRLGVLPTPLSVELGVPLDDVASLRLSYPVGAPAAGLLATPVEVALETHDPAAGAWTEVDGGRFLRIKRSGDITDPTGTRSYELPSYAWILRKARLFPSPHDNTEGKRPFSAASAGTILATLITEAKARGALPGLGVDFTPGADSAGAAWTKVLTIAYEPGIDVFTVLDNMADQGVIDWTTSGRVLRVFNADTTLGRQLATGDAPVDLRLGRDITDAPDTATLEDLASAVYVKGEGASRLELVNPNAPTPWGRWESFITQGGVRDEGTMRLLAEAELTRTGRERIQITRALSFTVARWLPFLDYRPGDYVLAPNDTGSLAPLRVRQITLIRDQTGALTGNLVLHDRFLERELRLAKRTAGIVGGATAGGGSGAQPAPEGPDPRTPAAPTGLIVDTHAYLDSDGAARGQITATWATVDQATDGTAIEVTRYELYQRPNIVGLSWTKLTETSHPDVSATGSPYDVSSEWAFKVRAVSRAGVIGPFSQPYAVTIAADAEAPPTPSAPILSTRLGVIHVEWDGRGAASEVMPRDFAHADVWMTAPGDIPVWTETWAYPNHTIDPAVWTVLHGNRPGSGTPSYVLVDNQLTMLGGSDLLATRDTGARDYTITTTNLFVGDQHRAGVVARYLPGPSPTSPSGQRSIHLTARRAPSGTADDIGLSIFTATSEREISIPLPAGSSVDGITLALTIAGRIVEVAVDNTPIHTETLTPTEDAALTGTAAGIYLGWPQASVGPVIVLPAGTVGTRRVGQLDGAGGTVVPDEPYFQPRTFHLTTWDRSGNQSAASDPATIATQPLVPPDLIGQPIYGDKIVANSITADRLAVGSVTAGAIRADAVTADKIAAGSIDGKTITGAVVRTAAANPRVQLDAAGLHAFNAAGTRTVDVSAATGAADIAGTLRTGTSGVRAIVTGSAFSGYPGVHFAGMSGNPGFEPTVHGREDGTLWLLSAEQTGNSSGRADLILRRGGAWALGKQYGNIATTTSLDAPGDGRLNITGIVPAAASSETMLFGGINSFTNAIGATISYARVNPNSLFIPIATCASPSGSTVRWAITNRAANSFSIGWSDTTSMIVHWLVFRSA